MERKLRILVTFFCIFAFGASAFSQEFVSAKNFYGENLASDTALANAYNAYAAGDYKSASFLFRRALADRRNQSDGALYMLVMAGVQIGDWQGAYADAEYFLSSYPESEYAPLIKYQIGRILFNLGEHDKALMALGDFCHENPESVMYPSALFLIGECFYEGYDFKEARPFYECIVENFPSDEKAKESKYRLDSIDSYDRQEKLLYILQQTGENYLASKESYERTLRRYELENLLGVREKNASENSYGRDSDEMKNVPALEIVPANSAAEEIEIEETVSVDERSSILDALQRLKISAAEAQNLLDRENGR
ncbi:MAG: tetratricopeptide repeat protein [Treponemataceae bacterium]|nr:tetratricopeptide repeat protein [Treponemataceae bacterium]